VEGIVHGFSTRLGGVSEGYEGSMNLSFGREQSRENVEENHRRLAEAIGYCPEQMVFSKQTHTTNVKVVTKKDCGTGYTKDRDFDDIDGLVTNEPGVVLTTFYADCVPLLMVDPVHRAIGCSHSGWRGTVADMAKATLDVMNREYGTLAKDVLAAIGPSICQDCYEVSEDVIEKFKEAFDEIYWRELFYKKENNKYQLNLWKANEIILLEAGVRKENIAVTNVCTNCNSDVLFSHRATKGERGSLAAFMALR
jgi:YfiH family protein